MTEETIEEMVTCMHRLFGDCPDCKRDYESEINNTHCPLYCEVRVAVYKMEKGYVYYRDLNSKL